MEGERQVAAVLGLTANNVNNFRRPLLKTRMNIMNDVETNYNQRGNLFGGWKPRKYSYPHPLLEKSGKMRRSFKTKTTSDTLEVSNEAKYFKYHQSNKPRGSNLPRRVMLKIIPGTRTKIFKNFQEHIVKSMKEASSGRRI